ncbi:response regulator [Actinomadura sp. BRA 177]|uniref:response regulator transcription factor n=1 Tax=Actinomadura sp. BRA 177 TaxID=2745202 RepID=UPI001596125F|nr:response regulator transcription factor [Actinomadura sp. BRA 177]NVI88086.1 response regulator transcription factor [Actinomadura sp. BRA 177]
MTVRIVIADDDQRIRDALRMQFAHDPGVVVVGEAADGHATVEQARRLCPDIVLMDIRMPGCSGIEATRLITADGFGGSGARTIKIIILTSYTEEAVARAIRAGADGYVIDRDPVAIRDAVAAVAAGRRWLSPEAIDRLFDEHTAGRTDPLHRGPEELGRLTPRERETMLAIARARNNAEIASDLSIEESTVKTYVNRIMYKLQLRDRAAVIVCAHRSGMVRPY